MTDQFAAAGADLDGELADIRAGVERLSARLGNTIDQLTARLVKNKGNLRDLIQGVIESAPFQKRRGDG